MANQAFFTKIRIREHKQIDATTAKPFNVILDPDVQREALARTEQPDSEQAGTNETPTRINVSEFRTSTVWCARRDSNP